MTQPLSPAEEAERFDDAPAAAPRRRPLLRTGLGLLLPAALLLLWHVLSTAGVFSAVQLPAPLAVLEAGIGLLAGGDLWTHVGISTQRVLIGFLIGAGLGLVAGSFIGLSRWGSTLVGPTIGAFRAVPSLAWVPLLLLWLGIDEAPKITLIAIGAFFPVYMGTLSGIRDVDRKLVELARLYGLGGAALARSWITCTR